MGQGWIKCKRCGEELHDSYPHYVDDKHNWYCWDCSFIKGFMTEKQYISGLPICLNMHARVVDESIEVWFDKNPIPPWERSNKQQRHSPRYTDWRIKVFQRDNYTCQDCGTRGGQLNAHHLKSWKDYKKLRFKVDNGITLCEKCHRKRHSKREVV